MTLDSDFWFISVNSHYYDTLLWLWSHEVYEEKKDNKPASGMPASDWDLL